MLQRIAAVQHSFMMWASPKYRSSTLATKLREFRRCAQKMGAAEIEVELVMFASISREMHQSALDILLQADTYRLMELGIRFSPDRQKVAQMCVERTMKYVRENMKLCGHGDRAYWAGNGIMVVHQWLTAHSKLPHDLEQELRDYATKLLWAHEFFGANNQPWPYLRQHLLT